MAFWEIFRNRLSGRDLFINVHDGVTLLKSYRRKRNIKGSNPFSANRSYHEPSTNSYHNERHRSEKRNRLGYTTGTCAAGAAKAAAIFLLTGDPPEMVSLLLPSGKRFWFPIKGYAKGDGRVTVRVPTVAADPKSPEIWVHLSYEENASYQSGTLTFTIRGGKGVGQVTKPGLPVAVGEDAIFPESQELIRNNLMELAKFMHFGSICQLSVTIEVPDGEKLARQSLVGRIGIVGGVAIQETPALRRMATPEAWHYWIDQALAIARESGVMEIVLTPGARGERFARGFFPNAPSESFILTADHIEHALVQSKAMGFSKIFYVGTFSKMLKIMTGKTRMNPKSFITSLIPIYHIAMMEKVPEELLEAINKCRNPREGLELLIREDAETIFFRICQRAHRNLARVLGNDSFLEVILISYTGEILSRFHSEERYGDFNTQGQPFAPSIEPVS